jgi:hypothetical protein
MPEHLTYFSELNHCSEAFRRALLALYLAESAGAPEARLATLRTAAQQALADMRKLLNTIEREHGLVEEARP